MNRACVQFEPDDPEFHKVTQLVYNHINERTKYDLLRSTRHYGPMVFYLAWCKNIDNLLFENVTSERIEDAALVIKLYYKLNPNKEFIQQEEDHIKIIQNYINTEIGSKRKLDNALKTYLELENERRKVQENIEEACKVTKNSEEELNK